MRVFAPLALIFTLASPPAFAADALNFDTGRDRVSISCAGFIAAQLQTDPKLPEDQRALMTKSLNALIYNVNIARAPEPGPLRDTHIDSVSARVTMMAQAYQFRMKKNLDAHGNIAGDDLLLLDEQIVCRDLYRQLEAEARG